MVSATAFHHTVVQTESNPALKLDSVHSHVRSSGDDDETGVFIRHPTGLPIRFRHCQGTSRTADHLNSSGGLCFHGIQLYRRQYGLCGRGKDHPGH